MENHPHTITHLFQKFHQHRCSPEELSRLYHYFDIDEHEDLLKKLILEELDKDVDSGEMMTREEHLSDLFDGIREKTQASNKIPLYKRLFAERWVQVAATLLVVAFGAAMTHLYVNNRPQIATTPQTTSSYPQPGSDKAVLTLFNGKKVVLDDSKQNQILQESGITVSNTLEGLLVYQVDESIATVGKADVMTNTMSTPRGGQYQIVLADGTKVWLNASSSLTFPSHFADNNRKVKLSGEAYFEVAHDARKPFYVQTAEGEVEVLGTTFNVMAYPDEQYSQITLLTGSVKVNRAKEAIRLLPGQQAEIKQDSENMRVHTVDLETIVAWKNGVFLFDQSELSQVMRQVGRWYNAEIEYVDKVPAAKLTGMVSRKDSLSVLLDILERAGGLDFEVQENKIMVKQAK